jgi:hypothetical protein
VEAVGAQIDRGEQLAVTQLGRRVLHVVSSLAVSLDCRISPVGRRAAGTLPQQARLGCYATNFASSAAWAEYGGSEPGSRR